MPKAAQETILSNIRYSAKAPYGSAWVAGPLYHAIAETDRPREADAFLNLIKVAEHPLDLPDPQSDALAIAMPTRIESPPRPLIGGLSAERQVPWTKIAALPTMSDERSNGHAAVALWAVGPILSLANGRSEAWVTDRTGHKSSAMVYRYKRGVRLCQELKLGPFLPLDEAIPELAAGAAKAEKRMAADE